jgi:thiol:disulfide interchange protein DsbC
MLECAFDIERKASKKTMAKIPSEIKQHASIEPGFDATDRGRAACTLIAALFLGVLPFASFAQGVRADSSADSVRATLHERLPQLTIEKIQPSPWPGLLEIVTDSEIVYSDSTGDLLFVGKILDTKKREDLTAKRWNETLRIDFNSLPFDRAIKIVRGNGTRKLAVFEDPQCPYCERLEHALDAVTDTTVYVFLFPIAELHPDAATVARDIWCASDRAAAWSDWMLKKAPPTKAVACTNSPIAELLMLGEKLKITVTPTLFFSDGNRVPGALTQDQIEKAFADRVAAN